MPTVRTPDGRLHRFPVGATPEQISSTLKRQYGAAPESALAAAPAPTRPTALDAAAAQAAMARPVGEVPRPAPRAPRRGESEFVRGFRSGLASQAVAATGRTLEAAAELAPPVTIGPGGFVIPTPAERFRATGRALVRAGEARAEAPRVPSIAKVRSAREFFEFAKFSAGQAIASTVPTVAGATAGTIAGTIAAGPPGALVGGIAGGAVPGYALNFGDVAEEVETALPKATPQERAMISAVIAVPITALDVLPAVRFGSRAAKKLMVQKVIQEATKRGLLQRVVREGGKGMTTEGATEALQETIQALSVAGVAGKPVSLGELVTRAVDAGIAGALAGGAIGGAVEAAPQRRAPAAARPVAPTLAPSVAEEAAVRANIKPPAGLSGQAAETARATSAELGQAIAEIQERAAGRMRFEGAGVSLDDAFVIPSLVRFFPGDPNPLRVTVLDRPTGRLHSVALPNFGALRQALGPAVAPRPVRAPAPGVGVRGPAVAPPGAEEVVRVTLPDGRKVLATRAEAHRMRREQPEVSVGRRRIRPGAAPVLGRAPAKPKVAAAARQIVPGFQFREEAAAKSVAASMARSEPGSEPKVIRTRRGFEIEVNVEAGAARQVKTIPAPARAVAAAPARPEPAPVPEPAARREPAAVPERQRRGAAPAEAEFQRGQRVMGPGLETGFVAQVPSPTSRVVLVALDTGERRTFRREDVRTVPGAPPATEAELRERRAPEPESAPVIAKRTFVEEFEDLARQGKTLEEATAQAQERSGSEPPAGLDLEARWSRVRRETQEALGQVDIFGGAALLGEPEREAAAPAPAAPREAPPAVTEAAPAAERPSEPKTVELEGLWYWEGFQQREVPRGTAPTQDPGRLVSAAQIRMLTEARGGFDIDEVVRRPILVWRDSKGELGDAGRLYVIDGHHRAYMAREAAAKQLPAVEVFGSLAYARSQAQLANLAGVPNTFSEQSRIARELRQRGDSWERVAAQLRVRVARAKAMVDFAHLEPSVRADFFPSGNEAAVLSGTAIGETVGRYARESPDVMTPLAQRQWLNEAVSRGTRPTLFTQQVKEWHDGLKAAKQETIELGGVTAVRLAMTPRQFLDTSGRLIEAIQAQRRQLEAGAKSLEAVAGMARSEGAEAAEQFAKKKLADVGDEGKRLLAAQKEVRAAIRRALVTGMRGETDLASSLDAIQRRVDEVVGQAPTYNPLVGEGGFVNVRDVSALIQSALRRLSGIVRRDPEVRRAARPPPRPPEVEILLEALRKAAPQRELQEEMFTAERLRRILLAGEMERGKRGRARLRARLAAQRGEFPKVDFSSIARVLNQEQVDRLHDMILTHPALQFYEQMNAGVALDKLLGELGGEVPQAKELELLEIVFGEELVNQLVRLRPDVITARALGYTIANVSRTLRTAFDLSAALRQGLFLAPSFPREWGAAWLAMHRYWASEERFQQGMSEILERRNARLYRSAGLSLTRTGAAAELSQREEAFLAGQVLAKVPLVRRSERAYVGFLNKLRADVFDALVEQAIANGRDPQHDPKLARELAAFVNSATGRGDSKWIEKHAQELNFWLFSARLQKSRIDLLNPLRYTRGDPFVRRQYIRSGAYLAGAATMVLTLAAWAGASVEWDRLNADWGKIRVGPIVYDILGGLAQYIRFYREVAVAAFEQATGRRGRREPTALQLIARFGETKLSPAGEFILGWLRGWRLAEGGRRRERFRPEVEALRMFVPMLAEDFVEVMKKDPQQLPVAVPVAAYGTGVQTYPRPRR